MYTLKNNTTGKEIGFILEIDVINHLLRDSDYTLDYITTRELDDPKTFSGARDLMHCLV